MNILKKMEETTEKIRHELNKLDPTNNQDIFIEGLPVGPLIEGLQLGKLASLILAHNGSKTFILDSKLLEAFQNTDIPLDMCPSDFKYPFDSFMIESNVPLCTQDRKIRQINTHNIIYFSSNAKKSFLEANLDKYNVNNDDMQTLNENYHEHTIFNLDSVSKIVTTSRILIPNNTKLKVALSSNNFPEEFIASSQLYLQTYMNVFYNTLLYINDPNRNQQETEIHETRLAGGKKGHNLSRQNYIILHAPKNYKSLSEGTGRTIDKRFIVRGHWRQQAYGEDRSLRKQIWIYPFYKGPEFGEVLNKPYLVKK
jgi:hypothetical protein